MRSGGIGVSLGARIRARREALRITQARLAESSRLTPNYIGMIERGEALPTLVTLVALAKALRTTAAELLGGEGGAEGWLEELIAVAKTVAPQDRELAIALVREVASRRRR